MQQDIRADRPPANTAAPGPDLTDERGTDDDPGTEPHRPPAVTPAAAFAEALAALLCHRRGSGRREETPENAQGC